VAVGGKGFKLIETAFYELPKPMVMNRVTSMVVGIVLFGLVNLYAKFVWSATTNSQGVEMRRSRKGCCGMQENMQVPDNGFIVDHAR
jgi:hypothetical protein